MTPEILPLPYVAAGVCDRGRVRTENQDRILLLDESHFYAVSDGMGGLPRGGDAAEYAVRGLPPLMEEIRRTLKDPYDADAAGELILRAVRSLSDRLFNSGNQSGAVYGATLCAIWFVGNRALFTGLGDSRGYRLRAGGELECVTEDMNFAGMLVKEGLLSPDAAAADPGHARLTAYVGMPSPADPRLWVTSVGNGDKFLLCSDGLYGLVPDREIEDMMRRENDPKALARNLVARANELGGSDNISAVCVVFDKAQPIEPEDNRDEGEGIKILFQDEKKVKELTPVLTRAR